MITLSNVARSFDKRLVICPTVVLFRELFDNRSIIGAQVFTLLIMILLTSLMFSLCCFSSTVSRASSSIPMTAAASISSSKTTSRFLAKSVCLTPPTMILWILWLSLWSWSTHRCLHVLVSIKLVQRCCKFL